MARKLSEQVVVITGATSGIGRETALQMAARGAKVVLAARNAENLRAVAQEIKAAGGEALPVVTDVAEWSQVEHLAQTALERYGQIDTWVNNAGISEYATVEDTSLAEIERIIQVNLLGQIYGIKAVLPHLKSRNEGTIINVASGLGERAVPLQVTYCASKSGVKGFTEGFRMELARQKSNIKITLILPSSINTPLFRHARSKMGVKPMPVPLVYQPEIVARAIVFAAENPRRDIYVGSVGKLLAWLERLSPAFLDWLMVQNGTLFKLQQTDEPPVETDNMFEPSVGPGRTHGEFGKQSLPISPYTSLLELHPNRKRLLLAGTIAGVVALVRRSGHS